MRNDRVAEYQVLRFAIASSVKKICVVYGDSEICDICCWCSL